MAYDPKLGGVLLFGGTGATRYRDTWLWDGRSWKPVGGAEDPGAPPAGSYQMVTDAQDSVALLLGQDSSGDWQQWAWDGQRWQQLSGGAPGGLGTNAGPALSAAYDSNQKAVFLFGAPGHGTTGFALTSVWKGSVSALPNRPSPMNQFVVDPQGRVGSLVLNQATQGDVVRVEGNPATTKDGNAGVGPGVPSYHALGYTCGGSSLKDCQTVFYLAQTTNRLSAFSTTDPRYHTPAGSRVGTNTATAQKLEGNPAQGGCSSGITDTTANASLILYIVGAQSQPTPHEVRLLGGRVSSLSLDAKQNSVGIQQC